MRKLIACLTIFAAAVFGIGAAQVSTAPPAEAQGIHTKNCSSGTGRYWTWKVTAHWTKDGKHTHTVRYTFKENGDLHHHFYTCSH